MFRPRGGSGLDTQASPVLLKFRNSSTGPREDHTVPSLLWYMGLGEQGQKLSLVISFHTSLSPSTSPST